MTHETARQRAARLAPLFLRASDADTKTKLAEKHDAADVLARADRVHEHLLAFAREHHLIGMVRHRLEKATRDERTWAGRALDGLRQVFVDSRPWASRGNPDVSVEEAREIVASLAELSPVSRLRAGFFLTESMPATLALEEGNEQAVVFVFRDFLGEATAHAPGDEEREALIAQARLEQDLFAKLDRGRDAGSDAGEALSEQEMLSLVRIIEQMPPARGQLFIDALATICLSPVAFSPQATTRNATEGAQEVLAERFWVRD